MKNNFILATNYVQGKLLLDVRSYGGGECRLQGADQCYTVFCLFCLLIIIIVLMSWPCCQQYCSVSAFVFWALKEDQRSKNL